MGERVAKNPENMLTSFMNGLLVRKQRRVNVFARESNMYSFALKVKYYFEIERK